MFVESDCICKNIDFCGTISYIHFVRSSFGPSADINVSSLALNLVKIYSFE